jgi:L-asparaginase
MAGMDQEPILVLTTGSTIDKQYFGALSEYQITDPIIARLLEIANVQVPFIIEEVMRKDTWISPRRIGQRWSNGCERRRRRAS